MFRVTIHWEANGHYSVLISPGQRSHFLIALKSHLKLLKFLPSVIKTSSQPTRQVTFRSPVLVRCFHHSNPQPSHRSLTGLGTAHLRAIQFGSSTSPVSAHLVLLCPGGAISLSLLSSSVTTPAVLSFPPTSQGPGLGGNEPSHTSVANISEQLCLSVLLLLLLNSEQKWTVYLTQ